MNRAAFFAAVRADPFGGSLGQPTVGGIEAILDAWEESSLTDIRWLAYMLATALGEVGRNMLTVREGFKATDAESRAYVKKKGYPYAEVINGQVFYGRGLVQLTWLENYQKMGGILGFDLVKDPDLALRPDIASRVMFEGMTRGTFTGKKLADYFNEGSTLWHDARRIINGLDRAEEIGLYGQAFHKALEAAAVPAEAPVPVPAPSPAPTLEQRVAACEQRLTALERNVGGLNSRVGGY